jgi:hypothetical protein
VFKTAAWWIQSTLCHPTYLRWILILSSHLCLGLPGGFPSLPCALQTPSGDEYKLWSSSLHNFLQSPVSSSLYSPQHPVLKQHQHERICVLPKFHTRTKNR